MALDSLCIASLKRELSEALLGGKVDKVTQPGRNEIVLHMRGKRENVKVLFSAEPGCCRVQLTSLNRENPAQPPVFCMLLRKHLTGGRLLEIQQPEQERILRFRFQCTDELGDSVKRELVLEMLGKGPNLILLDGEERILACTRRVEGDLASGKRQVMPGLFYHLPEPFFAVPPLLKREAEFRGLEPAEAYERWAGEIQEGRYEHVMLCREGKGFDVSFLPILQYGPEVENRRFGTFGEMLDEYFAKREMENRAKQRGGDLLKTVKALRQRVERKLGNQSRELLEAQEREGLRIRGDLLTSNLYAMRKGMSGVRLVNYYDPEGSELEIELDPLLTPQQNAARYYKAYSKAKTAEAMLTGQVEKGKKELEYLDSVAENLLLAESERDFLEIRQELEAAGYLRAKKTGKKVMKVQAKPLEFTTSAGLKVSVGKTGSQNDRLTCQQAGKTDWWFHTQKIHGAHVILWCQGKEPDEQSVLEAAQLAAFFSAAGEGSKVPVDYTQVKYVKKPAGAKPGMVVYTVYQTAMVEPKKL